AARVDRGGLRLTEADVATYCEQRGIARTVTTSALTGAGLDELVEQMKAAIDWNDRPRTITTDTFKEIKDYVLGLKEAGRPELVGLTPDEHDLLLDSAVAMFLSHNLCFRSTDPLNGRTYLVFPDLINLQQPTTLDDVPVEETVSYTVTGAIENVYASLVVLLG